MRSRKNPYYMLYIKPGDRQPKPCRNCSSYHGYIAEDRVQKRLITEYSRDGENVGISYSDSERVMYKGTTPRCCNCNKPLDFRLIRGDLPS